MKIFSSVLELVGKTPLIKLSALSSALSLSGELIVKAESFNPAGSVKDRVGLNMIEDAENTGRLKKGGCVIEPTSGNTGIGLAMACAVKGYRLILTMPSSMSVERRKILSSLGAEIVLTDASLGMAGAVARAEQLQKEIDGSIIAGQFDNPANPDAHKKSTAQEILADTDGKIDYFVAGVGTGGTLTGVGEVLKKEVPGVKIVAVEPFDSPLLSQGKAGAHKIQGIGANFIPSTLNRDIIDEIVTVKTEDAYAYARLLGKKEGFTTGISGGAALYAGVEILRKNEGKRVVVLLPDGGEKYLSTDLFE